jgi:hypothetical protein
MSCRQLQSESLRSIKGFLEDCLRHNRGYKLIKFLLSEINKIETGEISSCLYLIMLESVFTDIHD